MFSDFTSLPDFTPRDSHSIWYRSSRSNPFAPPTPHTPQGDHQRQNGHHPRQQREQLLENSALSRLAAYEQYIQRRRLNIQNYGSGWLKPPGIPKTLHQMREEKREQEEHQEALRREQLAQELAEAEAGNVPEDGMDDVQLDGAQDLDDDIPDAEDEYGMPDDDDDDDDEENEENESDDDDGRHVRAQSDESVLREERQNDLIAARMRMSEDAFREALVRGEGDGGDMYGGEDEVDEEDQGHILDEDDFTHDDLDGGLGMDMDADLDGDIPDAEGGGYEHTDSEAELSSSEEEESEEEGSDEEEEEEDDEVDMSFMPRSAAMPPPSSPTLHPRPSTGRASIMDISNILSQDGSSFMDSSPAAGRRARQ